MGNSDKLKTKKCRRKIRIRLADPNDPDSYVCEIFDSSLEDDEEYLKNDEAFLEEKPKNYFELLMPKKRKNNAVINTVDSSKGVKFSNNEGIIEKNQKNINLLTQNKSKERDFESDSSEDESLFQIQEKYKVKNFDLTEESNCIIEITEEEVNNEAARSKSICRGTDPPKVDISQKKAFSILNYFSKTQTSLKNKENCDLKVVRHPHKTCNTKSTKEHDVVKTKQNEKKIPLHCIDKQNIKLAPLFYKKENKVIDSAIQKARLEFLFNSSSLLSTVKKSQSKVSDNILDFPTVFHVQQRNDSVCWSHREICLPLCEVSNLEAYVYKNHKKFSLKVKPAPYIHNEIVSNSIEINKEYLCRLKCKYLELKLDWVIDGLKEKKDKFLARAKEIEKKSKTQTNLLDPGDNLEEFNSLWTEKYKPKSCEILGNDKVVRKMKKWLQSWKLFDEELKALVKNSQSCKNQKEEEDDDDGYDDFLVSDSEKYGLKAPGNVCIISGPNGCGKTALVNALANELEYGVLELNASSKRTGKKVLSDLQEATQSHKVHRVNLAQANLSQNDNRKKINRKKKKFKTLEPKKILDQSNDSKISLILIEDADIVFEEHDEGFFSAIQALVQTSKRPIVFLTNEPNCHSLYNLKVEQCLILEMELPNFYTSCAVLETVALLEGASFEKEILESVVRQNNFDLRKSLLQLQFWIHSGRNPIQKKFDLGHLWWGLSKFLYKQDIKHFVKPNTRKRKRENDLFDSSNDEMEITPKKIKTDKDVSKDCLPSGSDFMSSKSNLSMESHFRVLDLASVVDRFSLPGSQEPIPRFECKERDSLCLEENMEEETWAWKNLAERISDELVSVSTRIFAGKENEKRELSFTSPNWEEICWRRSQERATLELSGLVSLQNGRDNRSLHLDYLPILRNICRVERNRSETNPKRKNRFYHYLNNLGFELTDENLEVNCDVLDR